ncbi:MAG: M20 family metallopeptidase [Actinomycetota bacterium]|nr:M20 family metallopeptidase [Actinomycetota bacterium]
MLDDLAELVSVESPSHDLDATAAALEVTARLAHRLLGSRAEIVEDAGRQHLVWSGGGPVAVVLVGHVDTVWPLGTLARWPFSVEGDRATGPGVFDMKAGIVQGLHALSCLADLSGVRVLLTTDEETGSLTSRGLIEATARGAAAALVLEPSAGGALKSARKGVSMYRIEVTGQAAHAGLEPEKGANAGVELAHQMLALAPLGRPEVGTTVTPTLLAAGSTTNTVPAQGWLAVDVRASTPAEQARIDGQMRALAPVLAGTSVTILGGPNRPPMPAAASADLLVRARRCARGLGLADLRDVAVGGGSDGNFTAGVGVPTLDGLGAVGDGAHAEGEYIEIPAMAERAALVAALVTDLLPA